jgi:hypothetical protein
MKFIFTNSETNQTARKSTGGKFVVALREIHHYQLTDQADSSQVYRW